MVEVFGNTLKEERPRDYNRNSTEFKFVFKSYSGVVARTTDLFALMSSMFKMRTVTSDRSATESWLIPIECGWDKGKNKEQEEKGNENPKSELSSNCRKWGHNDASGWHGKEKKVNRVRSSSSSTLVATDVDTTEWGGKRRRELAWYGRWFHNDQTVLRGLCVTSVHVCPKSYATYATLSLKFWGMREVVYNEMNLHGEVFTVKVFAVVCEGTRRQLLSMIWREIEGFLFDSR